MSKPLPPHAKRARVVAQSLWIRCGIGGWRFLKQYPNCGEVVFPADSTHASAYQWPVRGLWCYVLPHGVDMARVAELVLELLKSGAASVYVLDPRFSQDGQKWVEYTPDELRRAV